MYITPIAFLFQTCINERFIFLVQSPPRIIKQPPTDELLFQVKSRADENDKPFIIECEADGEPAPMWVILDSFHVEICGFIDNKLIKMQLFIATLS